MTELQLSFGKRGAIERDDAVLAPRAIQIGRCSVRAGDRRTQSNEANADRRAEREAASPWTTKSTTVLINGGTAQGAHGHTFHFRAESPSGDGRPELRRYLLNYARRNDVQR